jgi:hypothetical protein
VCGGAGSLLSSCSTNLRAQRGALAASRRPASREPETRKRRDAVGSLTVQAVVGGVYKWHACPPPSMHFLSSNSRSPTYFLHTHPDRTIRTTDARYAVWTFTLPLDHSCKPWKWRKSAANARGPLRAHGLFMQGISFCSLPPYNH